MQARRGGGSQDRLGAAVTGWWILGLAGLRSSTPRRWWEAALGGGPGCEQSIVQRAFAYDARWGRNQETSSEHSTLFHCIATVMAGRSCTPACPKPASVRTLGIHGGIPPSRSKPT